MEWNQFTWHIMGKLNIKRIFIYKYYYVQFQCYYKRLKLQKHILFIAVYSTLRRYIIGKWYCKLKMYLQVMVHKWCKLMIGG